MDWPLFDACQGTAAEMEDPVVQPDEGDDTPLARVVALGEDAALEDVLAECLPDSGGESETWRQCSPDASQEPRES